MKPLSYIAAIALSLFAVISVQGQTIKKYVGEFSVPVSNAILGIEMFSDFYRWDMYGTGYYHYYEKDGKQVPIVGLPGCVMYAARTIFDLVLHRIMADDMITADDLADLGLGGLCLNCKVCTFPNCGFGKGAK